MITGHKPKAATFKLVLAELEADRFDWGYICHALQLLSLKGAISEEQYESCRKYIVCMLHPYISYGSWLSDRVPELSRSGFMSHHAQREGRIAWVKHIINVLES